MSKKFDLEERTGKFGEDILAFVKKIPKNKLTLPLITQLIKSGTSIGANYYEADCAESRKDFEHKLGICKKESKETKYWLRMIAKVTNKHEETRALLREAGELNLIFTAIIRNSRINAGSKH